jgi:hypothetical protein
MLGLGLGGEWFEGVGQFGRFLIAKDFFHGVLTQTLPQATPEAFA